MLGANIRILCYSGKPSGSMKAGYFLTSWTIIKSIPWSYLLIMCLLINLSNQIANWLVFMKLCVIIIPFIVYNLIYIYIYIVCKNVNGNHMKSVFYFLFGDNEWLGRLVKFDITIDYIYKIYIGPFLVVTY